ncbi:metal ABC transporter substrate-binding protein [Bacillus sp. FJAT-44742]|uniref:metal ABC transporter substrate-binding protein n=1 Tax=Bacillus sp. FJAT-44742 TaxID=2014005 RepID=UPI001E45C054|nr:metal ABC transporter substrate-binding protein [Bacillus sp. FJAT-44742]
MKKWLVLMGISTVVVTGCGEMDEEAGVDETAEEETVEEEQDTDTEDNNEEADGDEDEIHVTTSFSVIGDFADNIVGDRGTVEYIVPIGEEPHEYEPVPSDFQKVSDSEVFYVNGLDLEEWLEGLVENVGDVPIVELSEGVDPIALEGDDGHDPHVWLSPSAASVYVENLVKDLVERDPEGEEEYRENAKAYLEELQDLHEWTEEKVEEVPEDNRIIVLSEDAFKYFGRDYGFETDGIWSINSHEEGTPGQINRIVDLARDEDLPALFLESTINPQYMETVAENSGVEIYEEFVYTDAVGQEGSGAETYIDMMEHNVETIVNGLSQ